MRVNLILVLGHLDKMSLERIVCSELLKTKGENSREHYTTIGCKLFHSVLTVVQVRLPSCLQCLLPEHLTAQNAPATLSKDALPHLQQARIPQQQKKMWRQTPDQQPSIVQPISALPDKAERCGYQVTWKSFSDL